MASTVKLVDYFVASLLVGLFITVLAGAIYFFTVPYGVTVDSESFDKYNQTYTQVMGETNSLSNETESIKSNTADNDILGNFFSQSYKAYQLTKNSGDIVSNIGSKAIEDNDSLGENKGVFSAYFTAIITVIFILAILAIALNREI